MNTNQIRLRYSGFIVFTVQVFSVITGLIFTLLLTRNMSQTQYGIWTNIFDYVAYFTLFSGMLPFWTLRFVARGKEATVKTAASAQLIIALASMVVYFPAIILISRAIGTTSYLTIYLIAGLYIFTSFMIVLFENALQSTKPEAVGYGLLIEEIVKVSVAIVLIMGFHQLFLGAVLGLVLSCFVQVLYYVLIFREELRQKINWNYLREWQKGSTAIVYNLIGQQLMIFALILLFFYGGSETRAYYQAALSFTTIIGYSASLAFALYPKLLAKACTGEEIGLSFKTVMMLAIPFSTIIIAMAVSFLTVLNVSYGIAWPVLIALTIDTLITLLSTFYNSCLLGAEHFDSEGKISMRGLIKSKIFKVFSLSYIQAAIALPTIYFVLTRLPVAGSVQAALYVITILIAVHLSTFIGLYAFMRHSIRIPVAWRSLSKYILASIVMGTILLVLPTTTTLLSTVGKALLGFLIYVGLLLTVDAQARQLLRLILDEIEGSKQMLISKNRKLLDENQLATSEN